MSSMIDMITDVVEEEEAVMKILSTRNMAKIRNKIIHCLCFIYLINLILILFHSADHQTDKSMSATLCVLAMLLKILNK